MLKEFDKNIESTVHNIAGVVQGIFWISRNTFLKVFWILGTPYEAIMFTYAKNPHEFCEQFPWRLCFNAFLFYMSYSSAKANGLDKPSKKSSQGWAISLDPDKKLLANMMQYFRIIMIGLWILVTLSSIPDVKIPVYPLWLYLVYNLHNSNDQGLLDTIKEKSAQCIEAIKKMIPSPEPV